MAEDLKITLSTELEADEEKSADHISEQLPNIAKLINSKSRIKVGVEIDEKSAPAQVQRITKQIQNAATKSNLSMKFNFGVDKVDEMVKKLHELQVPENAINGFVSGIDKGVVGITEIKTGLSEVGDSARTVTATVEGITSAGERLRQTLTQSFQLDGNTQQWQEGVRRSTTAIIQNYEQLAREEEKTAQQMQVANDKRIAALNNLESKLKDVQAKYLGLTTSNGVTDSRNLLVLNQEYDDAIAKIEELRHATGSLSETQKSEINSMIADLERYTQQCIQSEKAATQLRTKSVPEIKLDQTGILNTLEERLRSSGILTEEFQSKLGGLRVRLNEVFDRNGITAFLAEFGQFKNEVSTFEARLTGANRVYQQLIANERSSTKIQQQLISNPGMDDAKRANLEGQLAALRSQHAELESQRATYADIVAYSSQARLYEQEGVRNQGNLNMAEAEVAQNAQRIADTADITALRVEELRQKYGQLSNPTQEITNRMEQLKKLQDEVNNATSDKEKIAAYERLDVAINDCNKGLTILNRMQGGEVKDFAFTQNLEKAKADLADVGRKWSALKQDPGLNAQFRQLEEGLRRVNNQADLKKWKSQFSAFTSEVKAAGKNMQSLGDIFKTNASKVLQWVSATTLLFRAFRLLKTGVQTVIDLDTAMVDLKKTTNETDEAYEQFYYNAPETAKDLGVTTKEIISQTAEWSRLGLVN